MVRNARQIDHKVKIFSAFDYSQNVITNQTTVFKKAYNIFASHYNDVIMGTMASQITSPRIVYLAIYSGADQRKHQSFASLAFVRGIHREFPAQMASNAENVSIWWLHHVITYGSCNRCHQKWPVRRHESFIFQWHRKTGLVRKQFNSLQPSIINCQSRSESTLAQVMACCLMAPSHYQNQCWLLIVGILSHSPESNLMAKLLFS